MPSVDPRYVTRVIPDDLLAPILSGQMEVWPGVIRWAPGTDQAGQIVRHLLLPATASDVEHALPVEEMARLMKDSFRETGFNVQALQSGVVNLNTLTESIATMSNATMVLSGLNLAASAIGFAVVIGKLNRIEKRLEGIAVTVESIRKLLHDQHQARLRNALQQVDAVSNLRLDDNKRAVLHASRTALGELVELYGGRLKATQDVEEAAALEELYVVCILAHVRCSAELGMLKVAREDMSRYASTWHRHTRRIAKELLLKGSKTARFLSPVYRDVVSLNNLARWNDFANETTDGVDGLDRLRGYQHLWMEAAYDSAKAHVGLLEMRTSSITWEDIGKRIKRMSPVPDSATLHGSAHTNWVLDYLYLRNDDVDAVAPLMYRFVGRSAVLRGYEAQYAAFEALALPPSRYETRAQQIVTAGSGSEPFFVDPKAFSLN